jgi:hypothetical protein
MGIQGIGINNELNNGLNNGLGNYGVSSKPEPHTIAQAKNEGFDQAAIDSMKNTGKIKCATCAARKYQDGSDEMVSFKSAAHISPEASAAKVSAHEHEHVSNAFKKAFKNDGRVLQATVSLKTAVCPECGRTYVAGGLTRTRIQYNLNNPYEEARKLIDHSAVAGMNFNIAIGEKLKND